ncbi:MAG: cobalt-precorrin-5B (C(1))-methyltransferase [Desulfobacterales bacterium]|nr:cobalt-precorrin-5B (C(1))-methyltransferase [Desulfobacterales bacterium]
MKRLKTGFTTGTAAAAAAKAAVHMLATDKAPETVSVALLTGDRIRIPIVKCSMNSNCAECTVQKDAGDDPDITHKAIIGARVRFIIKEDTEDSPLSVNITGGYGVGKVTKPGLEIPPGEPAVNLGPRKMILQSVREALDSNHCPARNVEVEVFVPNGVELAKKTLNARLGIIDGISILGTTGIVKPLSHEAYIATIESALSVARAAGLDTVVLTTGRRSERYARQFRKDFPGEAFIQIGDYFRDSIHNAVQQGFRKIILAVFFAKAVKMAQGFPNTHAANAQLDIQRLADWAMRVTNDKKLCEEITEAVAARHVLELIRHNHNALIHEVGKRMTAAAAGFAGSGATVEGVIFDYNGHVFSINGTI